MNSILDVTYVQYIVFIVVTLKYVKLGIKQSQIQDFYNIKTKHILYYNIRMVENS